MWGGFQGCTPAQGEDVKVGAGEMWPGQWGDKLCVHPVAILFLKAGWDRTLLKGTMEK